MTVLPEEAGPGAAPDRGDDPLLGVRLSVPGVPHRFLERDRLTSVLDRAADVPLTLVSGPAGSGKTALAAAWVATGSDVGTAWMTFDEGEARPEQLWPDLLECLRRHGAPVADPARAGVDGRPPPVMEVAVAAASLTEPLTVVLDGCELVSPDLAGDLDFVLRHSGGLLHLVMLTRIDPALPLHRYRLDESVVELRTADLAFTEEETARLLELYDVDLSPSAVLALHRRTRGWAAALRFAIMVLERASRPDTAAMQLAGDRGNIAEYLMAEVFRTQPEDVRELLMHTSVVDVLQPGLIEELGGTTAGYRLDLLARANLLVEAVADRPGWYRYHPLLRDLLRSELAHRSPAQHQRLHLAAARWFARENALGRAVALAAEVGAWGEAARFAVEELAIGRLLAGPATDEVVRVLRTLPPGIEDPHAAVVRAALALGGEDPVACSRELSLARASTLPDQQGRWVRVSVELLDAIRACRAKDPGAVLLADRALRDAQALGADLGAHSEVLVVAQLCRARDAAAGPRRPVVPAQRRPPMSVASDRPPEGQVIEALTAKELEVLGHLSELLATEEIATEMFVSVNTIRTHVRSILRKLAVSRRNEAVRRGRALGLVP